MGSVFDVWADSSVSESLRFPLQHLESAWSVRHPKLEALIKLSLRFSYLI